MVLNRTDEDRSRPGRVRAPCSELTVNPVGRGSVPTQDLKIFHGYVQGSTRVSSYITIADVVGIFFMKFFVETFVNMLIKILC